MVFLLDSTFWFCVERLGSFGRASQQVTVTARTGAAEARLRIPGKRYFL